MRILSERIFLLAGLFTLICLGTAQAVPVGYTDQASFLGALPGSTNLLNFDTMTYGDTIGNGQTVDGITFNYDFGGVQMMVTDDGGGMYPTTSSPNLLGTNDGDMFQDGDDFGLSFASSNAIGMYFITADDMLDDDISLSVGGESVLLDSNAGVDLGNDWYAFFLGIVDTENTFTGAQIATWGGGGAFLYNVDDITTSTAAPIPEPTTIMLLGLGLLVAFRFKGNSRQ